MEDVRAIRRNLLEAHRYRGRLLTGVLTSYGITAMLSVAEACQIRPEEAWACIHLYERWEQFAEAERWADETPATCRDALRLIKRWQEQARQ